MVKCFISIEEAFAFSWTAMFKTIIMPLVFISKCCCIVQWVRASYSLRKLCWGILKRNYFFIPSPFFAYVKELSHRVVAHICQVCMDWHPFQALLFVSRRLLTEHISLRLHNILRLSCRFLSYVIQTNGNRLVECYLKPVAF